MKYTIAFLIVLSLLAPSFTRAATPEEQYQQALREVIALLIQQVQILQAQLLALGSPANPTSTIVLSVPDMPVGAPVPVPTWTKTGVYSLEKYFPDGKQFVAYSLTECEVPELGGPQAIAKPFTFNWGIRLMEQDQLGGSTKWNPIADEDVTVTYGDQVITGRTNQDGVFLFTLNSRAFSYGERASINTARLTGVTYSSRFKTTQSTITESFGCR